MSHVVSVTVQTVLVKCPCCDNILEVRLSAADPARVPMKLKNKLTIDPDELTKVLEDACDLVQAAGETLKGFTIHCRPSADWPGVPVVKDEPAPASEADYLDSEIARLQEMIFNCSLKWGYPDGTGNCTCDNCKELRAQVDRLRKRREEVGQQQRESSDKLPNGLKELPLEMVGVDPAEGNDWTTLHAGDLDDGNRCSVSSSSRHNYRTTEWGGICSNCGQVQVTHNVHCDRHHWVKRPGMNGGYYCASCGVIVPYSAETPDSPATPVPPSVEKHDPNSGCPCNGGGLHNWFPLKCGGVCKLCYKVHKVGNARPCKSLNHYWVSVVDINVCTHCGEKEGA